MLILIAIAVMIGVAMLLKLLLEETLAGYILSLLSLVTAFLVSVYPDELRILRERAEVALAKIPPLRRTSFLQWASRRLRLFDLSLLITAILLLVPAFFSSFEIALADMQSKGYIVFPENSQGIYHLKIYALGYLATPSLFLALALYGLYRASRESRVSLLEIFLSTLLGFIMAILLASIVRGSWSGPDGLRQFLETANAELPAGAAASLVVLIFVVLLASSAVFGLYTWMFTKIGAGMLKALHGLAKEVR